MELKGTFVYYINSLNSIVSCPWGGVLVRFLCFAFGEGPDFWGRDLVVYGGLLPNADNRWPECRKMRIFAIARGTSVDV